jgi:transposase
VPSCRSTGNPKRSHDAAEVCDGVPSLHDAKSAAIVAKLHFDGASEPWPATSDHQRDLAAARRVLEIYQTQFQQNRNRLEGVLARFWPELPRVLDLSSVTLLTLVSEFGAPHEVSQRREEAKTLMSRVGGHLLDPDRGFHLKGPLRSRHLRRILDPDRCPSRQHSSGPPRRWRQRRI